MRTVAGLRVMEAGDGEPLLFLHGWGLSPRAYADGIAKLGTGGVRVIAPALPGFDGSDGPGWRDVDRAWWTIPTEVAKNGRSHRVPLSPQALAILDQLSSPSILRGSARARRS